MFPARELGTSSAASGVGPVLATISKTDLGEGAGLDAALE